MPTRRSYISPSTNPARAPFCGPPAAPAAAASASTTCTVTPAGRRSANSVCLQGDAATMPTSTSRSSGPWTNEANISRLPGRRRPRSRGWYSMTSHEVQAVDVGERLHLDERALGRRAGVTLDHGADEDAGRGHARRCRPAVNTTSPASTRPNAGVSASSVDRRQSSSGALAVQLAGVAPRASGRGDERGGRRWRRGGARGRWWSASARRRGRRQVAAGGDAPSPATAVVAVVIVVVVVNTGRLGRHDLDRDGRSWGR